MPTSNTAAVVANRPVLAKMALRLAEEKNATITPDKMIVLFHGTRSAKKIRREGILNAGSYLTEDETTAMRFANARKAFADDCVQRRGVELGSEGR